MDIHSFSNTMDTMDKGTKSDDAAQPVRRPRLRRPEIFAIWDWADANPDADPADAAARFAGRARQTVARYVVAFRWLRDRPEQGNPPKLLPYQVDAGTISSLRPTFAKWLSRKSEVPTTSVPQAVHAEHLKRMFAVASEVRKCIYNPGWELVPYVGRPRDGALLFFGQGDWTIYPRGWLECVAPDLSDDALWGEDLPAFRQHAADSPIWTRLNTMREEARLLQQDIDAAAQRLADANGEFRPRWDRWRAHLSGLWVLRESVTPSFPRPDESKLAPYEQFFPAATVTTLLSQGLLPDLPGRADRLWRLLEACRADLAPDTIAPLVAAGHCQRCSSWGV